MHHNILSFWRSLENLPSDHRNKPSPRICNLLQEMFEKWHSKPPWIDQDQLGHLFDYFKNDRSIQKLPIIERKGLAIQKTLEVITRKEFYTNGGTMEIHPLEVIVGSAPPYSVGQGKELIRYLTDEESLYWEIRYFNEWSPFGHTVPNHQIIIEKGTTGIIDMCQSYISQTADDHKKSFYKSVISAMEGVNHYANAYADRCDEIKNLWETNSFEYQNLDSISERLRRIPALPSETFLDALQCIQLMHCALHFTGEIVPIGRLDQLLIQYYLNDLSKGIITEKKAQEAIDAFWIKLDEKVLLNRRFAEDRFTSSDGALLGSGAASNFDQGALLNQWMQQITIGGVLADNATVAKDAANKITEMCLNSARRLPLNSPTLDLRVHKKTSAKLLKLAAEALLSGGAHPVLLNDDRIIPALHKMTGGNVELASARNYACDGCFETLFAGETEFSFGFVPAIDLIDKSLNSGAAVGAAGASYLRGMKGSYRTPTASNIAKYSDFYLLILEHMKIGCHKFYNGILNQYGIKEGVSPSPLLSAMINGCLESGRDISGGGARYKLFSPLMTGISTATDSLFVIKKLVYEDQFMTLEELVSCLRTNWGGNEEVVGLKVPKKRIAEIRQACMSQKKFGYGHKEVDSIAWKLIEDFYNMLQKTKVSPIHLDQWKNLEDRYGSVDHPFEILIAPGVGTFEQYVFGGSFAGATPDGRMASTTIASDLSPAPKHADLDPLNMPEDVQKEVKLLKGLESYKDKRINLLSDGAPADFNIREDFPVDDLAAVLSKFAKGDGGNILTITVANPETMQGALTNPEAYNLLRVRMGGWTEFFITLFPAHKEQHRRRPVYHTK